MKKILTIIIVFLFASCALRQSEPFTGKTFMPANSNVARGETLFMEKCNKCHPSAEAGLGPSLLANPAPQFIKRFQMRHGLGVMPGFSKDELKNKDLKDISAYLKAWKKY